MKCTQVFLSPAPRRHEANLTRRFAIEQAAWIWHPDCGPNESCFLRFELAFEGDGAPLRLHVSADQTVTLFCNDGLIMRGPACSEPGSWAFHTYELSLAPGRHRLRAEVWRLEGDRSPGQRLSTGGGFILAGEGRWHSLLSTGYAPWTVSRRRDATPLPAVRHLPTWIGCGIRWDLRVAPDAPVAASVQEHWWENIYGIVGGKRKLAPVDIPDPREELVTDLRVAAAVDAWVEPADPFPPRIEPGATAQLPAVVPARAERSVLLDLGTYRCGFPQLTFEGGAAATVECRWAESLIESGELAAPRHCKGHRDAIAGKRFFGFGDAWVADGRRQTVTTHWWRSGRYLLLRVRTAEAPLVLHSLAVRTTGYPWLQDEPTIETGDERLQEILRLGWRGFVNCTHDLFIDCPFYEQMQYVADTRIMILTSYVSTGDDRLARRSITAFDQSRIRHGLPAMRAPSRCDMVSTTFALWWVGMVFDFARWRRDPAFVAARLEGVRSTLDQLDEYRNNDGLLEAVPGWPFIDWGTPWDDPAHPEAFNGVPPGARGGVSSLVNLHDALAREQAAALEDYVGLPALADRRRAQAAAIRAACRRFVDRESGLLCDAEGLQPFSEHAQVFGLLAGLFAPHEAERAWARLRAGGLPARASIYFLHHLFDAAAFHGCASIMLTRLGPWHEMLARGLRTPTEEPEPSRSDCHGWGCHPLFHVVHGLLGLQPAGFEFRRARLRPDLGSLPFVDAQIPHPDGLVHLRVEKQAGAVHLSASLPDGFVLQLADGRELAGGSHRIRLAEGRESLVSGG